MASASFVEIISHFAGYLQIFQDIARDRIEYDETLAPHRSDDYTTPRPDHDQPFTPDDLEPQAGPAPNPIPDDPVQLAHLHPIKALSHPQDPDLDFFPPSHFPNIRLPMPGGGGGGGGSHGDHHIKVAYQPGGEQTEVEVHQHNIMFNDTTMLPADAVLWTAHCCRKNGGVSAPWLSVRDLSDLDVALTAVRAGQGHGKGFYPRVFPVNEEMTLATGFPWNNR